MRCECVWYFTRGRNVSEALVLASFPLAVAHVEVYMDGGGQSLVSIGRDFNEERILQCRDKKINNSMEKLGHAFVLFTTSVTLRP